MSFEDITQSKPTNAETISCYERVEGGFLMYRTAKYTYTFHIVGKTPEGEFTSMKRIHNLEGNKKGPTDREEWAIIVHNLVKSHFGTIDDFQVFEEVRSYTLKEIQDWESPDASCIAFYDEGLGVS